LNSFLNLSVLAWLGFSAAIAHAVDAIPPKPLQGISDSAQVLSLAMSKSVERLLFEHQSLTSETLLVLTLKNSPSDESLPEFAARTFDQWKGATPKPPSAVVLVFDTDKNRFSWKAGVGLDSVLAERGADLIGSKIAQPELAQGRADRAVLLSVRRVFELLESPVFVNGKFDTELRAAGFYETFTPVGFARRGWSWWIWILCALGIAGFIGYRITCVEIHYTAAGWHRVSAWESLRRYFLRIIDKRVGKKTPRLTTGGGVSGNY